MHQLRLDRREVDLPRARNGSQAEGAAGVEPENRQEQSIARDGAGHGERKRRTASGGVIVLSKKRDGNRRWWSSYTCVSSTCVGEAGSRVRDDDNARSPRTTVAAKFCRPAAASARVRSTLKQPCSQQFRNRCRHPRRRLSPAFPRSKDLPRPRPRSKPQSQ